MRRTATRSGIRQTSHAPSKDVVIFSAFRSCFVNVYRDAELDPFVRRGAGNGTALPTESHRVLMLPQLAIRAANFSFGKHDDTTLRHLVDGHAPASQRTDRDVRATL